MSNVGAHSPQRTNCGKPLYRFGYEKNKITLATPCFEPTCNTCAWQQPTMARFQHDFISPHMRPEAITPDELHRRSTKCFAAIDQQLRRIGNIRVRNAPPVKVRKGMNAVQDGRVEKKKRNEKQQRYTIRHRFGGRVVLKFEDRLEEYKTLVRDSRKSGMKQRQLQKRGRRVVLRFSRLEEFGRLSRKLADQREPAPQAPAEGMKLFLIIGKDDSLRCDWR